MPRITHVPRRKIPTTNWTLIAQAREPGQAQRHALDKLLVNYRPALLTFLLVKHRCPHPRAEDLVQGFISDRILEKNLFSKADRTIGRFRNFLLTAFENYARNEFRKTTRAIQAAPLEEYHQVHSPAQDDPSHAFQKLFAQNVIRLAVSRMQELCVKTNRNDLWIVFEGRILRVFFENQPPMPYPQLVQACAFEGPTQAMNALITAKRMYKRLLEGVIAEYVGTQDEVDDEVADLLATLGN